MSSSATSSAANASASVSSEASSSPETAASFVSSCSAAGSSASSVLCVFSSTSASSDTVPISVVFSDVPSPLTRLSENSAALSAPLVKSAAQTGLPTVADIVTANSIVKTFFFIFHSSVCCKFYFYVCKIASTYSEIIV